jgi:hypothetical protein
MPSPQVSEFLFGDGFAVAPGDKWRVRRRAVAPSLHKTYLQTMVGRVFGPSGMQLNAKLEVKTSLLHSASCIESRRPLNYPTSPFRKFVPHSMGHFQVSFLCDPRLHS